MVWLCCKLQAKSELSLLFVSVAYWSTTFGVASQAKGLLDDCKKLAMNRLYLVNVLGNLPLPLLFECFHCFDVSVFAMSASRTMSFQEVKCSVLKWVQVSSISSCSHICLVDGNEFTSILAVLGVSTWTW